MYCEEGFWCKMCECGKECDHWYGDWNGVLTTEIDNDGFRYGRDYIKFDFCPKCGKKL